MNLDLVFNISDLAKAARQLEQAWNGEGERRKLVPIIIDDLLKILQNIRASMPTKIQSLITNLNDSEEPLDTKFFSNLSNLINELIEHEQT